MPTWLHVLIAVFIGYAIWTIGIATVRSVSSGRGPGGQDPGVPAEPEDVQDLDVSFVCKECGTELRVTKLGQAQVPRHCGEPMDVVHRPGGGT